MAENSSIGASSMALAPTRSDDPACAHGLVPDCDTQDLINGQLEEYKKATEPSLLDGDDISWETIEAPLSTLTLENEETCFDEENELGGNDQLLECLVDDFPYIPPQDQYPYFYVKDGDNI
ncbi:hypothetical protein POTOM_005693 [Populus tomentosa]|uniref:Uncharacterized protein n=1 Tax=Populus tomentosa TaxID=118781 RepID=A0A8X8ASC6_POPTO|nr:hypothetical protein POTOM_005693 [Populus tomentosa]